MRRAVREARTALWHLRRGGPAQLRTWFRRRHRVQGPSADGVRRLPGGGLTFEPWPLDGLPCRRPGLRAAVVLDDFSRLALRPEWVQVEVQPSSWRETLEAEPVDLLFVESAWAGNGGGWRYHLTGPTAPRPALVELVEWCRERGVPTVFWNKEDPTHHEDFLDAARLFDHVLTTDGTLLGAYREALGHDRVGVMPFAAQAAIHHPVRLRAGAASRDVVFAGMWFAHRHEERREQMRTLLTAASAAADRTGGPGLEIFSRQLGGDERYQFPAPFDAHVVGSLDYPRMLAAYRAYKVVLNVNTVTSSPTMCARRIVEATACGAAVVSTPSPAIDAVFSEGGVLQVSQGEEAEHTVRALVRSRELRDRLVHTAQRAVWSGHTYAHRVDDVLGRVGLAQHRVARRPSVSALVSTNRPHQLDHVMATVGGQRGLDVELVLLAHGFGVDEASVRARATEHGLSATVLTAGADVPLGECLNRLVAAASGDLVAKMDDDDVYGPQYLSDQAYALDYSGADVVGKHAHYLQLDETVLLRFGEREHRFTDFVMGPTIMTRREAAAEVGFAAIGRGEDTQFLADAVDAGLRVYSADRFNFLQVRRSGGGHTWTPSEAELLASGDVSFIGDGTRHVTV